MFLIFDTDYTGLPQNWNAPLDDFNNWPRLVKIAWRLHDAAGMLIEEKSCLVKPDGFAIPKVSEKIHGVTTEIATKDGYDIKFVLREFNIVLTKANIVVAHNIEFDNNIVGSEMLRYSIATKLFDKVIVDTKTESTEYCALLGQDGNYRWPTLENLYFKLFNDNISDSYDIVTDLEATSRCFFELLRLGIIDVDDF